MDEAGVFGRTEKEAITGTRTEIQSDPDKRFRVFVNAVANQLKGEGILNLYYSEIDEINRGASEILNAGYKNPTTFILGYSVLEGPTINKRKLEKVVRSLPDIQVNVKVTDIIRYARLWVDQLV